MLDNGSPIFTRRSMHNYADGDITTPFNEPKSPKTPKSEFQLFAETMLSPTPVSHMVDPTQSPIAPSAISRTDSKIPSSKSVCILKNKLCILFPLETELMIVFYAYDFLNGQFRDWSCSPLASQEFSSCFSDLNAYKYNKVHPYQSSSSMVRSHNQFKNELSRTSHTFTFDEDNNDRSNPMSQLSQSSVEHDYERNPLSQSSIVSSSSSLAGIFQSPNNTFHPRHDGLGLISTVSSERLLQLDSVGSPTTTEKLFGMMDGLGSPLG